MTYENCMCEFCSVRGCAVGAFLRLLIFEFPNEYYRMMLSDTCLRHMPDILVKKDFRWYYSHVHRTTLNCSRYYIPLLAGRNGFALIISL